VTPLRLLVVMPLGTALGGGEQMLRQLLQHGRASDVAWSVVFLRDGPMVAEARALGITTHLIDAGRFRDVGKRWRAIRAVARLAREQGADAIVGWMVAGQITAGAAAVLAGTPAVWYQVGTPRPDWLDRLATLLPAAGILVLSKAGEAAQRAVWPRRPLALVYPGAALGAFDPEALPSPQEARRELGLTGPGPWLGLVGRLQRWKGMHTAIAALPAVRTRHPDAQLVIVGAPHETEPAYPDELRALAARLGVTDAVRFAGFQRDVPRWMQAMDVILHTSDREPFGIVVIEAMALGKPLVAGAGGGPAEIVTDGADALLAPFEDVGALAGAITRLLDDPATTARMGAAARRRAAEFSDVRYARHVVEAVRSFLQDTR
jgi:glycosyltransferase involved in cell wall biosynthesis